MLNSLPTLRRTWLMLLHRLRTQNDTNKTARMCLLPIYSTRTIHRKSTYICRCRHKTINYTLLYSVYMMQYYRVYRSLKQGTIKIFFFSLSFSFLCLDYQAIFIAFTASLVNTRQVQAQFKSAGTFKNSSTSSEMHQRREVQICLCIWKSANFSHNSPSERGSNQPVHLKTRQLFRENLLVCHMEYTTRVCIITISSLYHRFRFPRNEMRISADKVSFTAARSRQDSWASPAVKVRPLEKKLGRKPATSQTIWRSAVKKLFKNFWPNFCQLFLKLGRN